MAHVALTPRLTVINLGVRPGTWLAGPKRTPPELKDCLRQWPYFYQ